MNCRRLQIHPRRHTRGAEGERGQILVLFTIVLVVILAFTALVVDIGLLRNDRQSLVNAVDAGALAGGTLMPVDGSKSGAAGKVTALVDQTVQATYPGLLRPANYDISYRCLIGTGDEGAFDGADIAVFIPLDCDPSRALGHSPRVGDFTGAGKTRSSVCRPDLGDKCNVVVVEGNVTTPYSFARVVGVNSGSTGVVQSAACKGLCGELPILNDVELVIDTSGSMSRNNTNGHSRIYWARLAAKQLVTDLSNNGGIGATGNRVGITTFSGTTASSSPTAWTSTAAQLATTIDAINAPSQAITPTKVGMQTGAADLSAPGHARNPVGGAVRRVLILLSDGRPNRDGGPNGLPATNPVNNMRPTEGEIDAYLGSADVAYSILIGNPANPYTIGQGPYLDPEYADPDMMKLLATPDDLTADPPLRYYFNVVDASGLPGVFSQIAGQILGARAHLIRLYPAPIVESVGGGTSVSISGKYFTGATQVTFGGTNAVTFTVNSDTSITATPPSGTPGQTVHVRVTSSGGSSPATPADEYTYPP